jgi:hypothetical protein
MSPINLFPPADMSLPKHIHRCWLIKHDYVEQYFWNIKEVNGLTTAKHGYRHEPVNHSLGKCARVDAHINNWSENRHQY